MEYNIGEMLDGNFDLHKKKNTKSWILESSQNPSNQKHDSGGDQIMTSRTWAMEGKVGVEHNTAKSLMISFHSMIYIFFLEISHINNLISV